jgi:hypothetical protein
MSINDDYCTWSKSSYSSFLNYYSPDYITFPYTEEEKLLELRCKKLNNILDDIILEFSECGLKRDIPTSFTSYVKTTLRLRKEKYDLVYDCINHELSFGGGKFMSLGDRDLIEITKEEKEIIEKDLLIWIYDCL